MFADNCILKALHSYMHVFVNKSCFPHLDFKHRYVLYSLSIDK